MRLPLLLSRAKGWLGERWLDKADKIAAIISMVVGVLALTYQLLSDIDWNFGSGEVSLGMNQRTDLIRKEAALVLNGIYPRARRSMASLTLERKG